MYAAVVQRRPDASLPSLAEARAIDRLRVWDDRIVAPRFGYRSAEHYYAEASVAPRLARLSRPALLVGATFDPMVPAEVVRPALVGGPPLLDVRWIREGGHVGFPSSLDLGLGGETGLEPQALCWLRRAGGGPRLAREDQRAPVLV
jgi:predicted alpha/beta-fold hydrolase